MSEKKGFDYFQFFKKNVICLVLMSVVYTAAKSFGIDVFSAERALSETIPFYIDSQADKNEIKEAFNTDENNNINTEESNINDNIENNYNDNADHLNKLITEDDIIYQPETDYGEIPQKQIKEEITPLDIESMKNLNYLKQKMYIVDSRTGLKEGDVNVDDFLNRDLTIDNTLSGPKILIFHTHSLEGFKDSNMENWQSEGIVGAGEMLKKILEEKYGVEVYHDMGRYDVVNGKSATLGAYERMEPNIQQILKDNPSIQVVIDMHRDGVNEDVHLVKNINGKDYAQIMFFNGLCRKNQNGNLVPTDGLENPYINDNLAFSFNMKMAADTLYPSISRKIYLNAYRYSLHMKPRSLLIEVGAQTNTKEEIFNSMEPLADILASVILKTS